MNTENNDGYNDARVHLIGVGGSGMAALAEMLFQRGSVVSGSDMRNSQALEHLSQLGVVTSVGQSSENIPEGCSTVVYSAAINDKNPELLAANDRSLAVMKYSQMLGRLMDDKVGIAIAGTHGKSTTTAMVAWALKAAGRDPSFIVGAVCDQLGGPSGVGLGEHFVAEACEYDRSFLHLRPKYATILNLEEDHLDCYKDLDDIIEAFRAFSLQIDSSGALVINGEDRSSIAAARDANCSVETFGLAEDCFWRGVDYSAERGCARMTVLRDGEEIARVSMSLAGLHNAYNALGACAMLHHGGVSGDDIGRILGDFTGTQRRMTFRGSPGGINIVDDYAHHPTELQATLKALRAKYQPKRLICIFQPHQHSRTRFLLKDFARSFGGADEVIVPDIFFVRDTENELDYISSKDLVSQIRLQGGNALYLPTMEEIVEHVIDLAESDDLVVTMGAGNIWQVADELVCRLG